jgi:galactokinase
MNKKLIKEVKARFKKEFKTKPWLIFSPGRINLIGEHTDYNDGYAFPAAINKGIALAIEKSHSSTTTIYAQDLNEWYEFNETDYQPIENGGWRNYILGVVSELQLHGVKLGHFNAVFSGDIPSGSGMSSSAALENSFAFGLNQVFGLGLTKNELILVSQRAEHNFAGVKCGIMDQYASMFGKKKSALLLDCRTITSQSFKIDFKDYRLMLINSNVKHNLSDSAYNDRREVCEKVSKLLNVKALRDATIESLKEIKSDISEDDYLKASYVINENNRVKKFANAIANNNINELGGLLFQSHHGLKSKYKVSCEELDFLVNEAKKNPNIVGARMMGGGFGGCTINIINKKGYKRFKKDISKKYIEFFNIECTVYGVKLSKGVRLVK